ncbi:hypothetical protein CP98_03669 [Sphingobium yanoikuyae]|uniref:Uncharacterized protein n=1 Tax=Sphingobium yanoikuyae TaxID=13690 RepID=A0A084EGS9_SPHYA|nr:hypothetical protein [Sphingobium yanoikuyae]KEZ17171.1 hypothetical protein CP98_03669 [Sphingobium yanoikuyae]
MADMYSSDRSFDPMTFGNDATKHTPADANLPINVKAVVCSADCTVDFKNAAGTARTGFPAKAGIPLPFVPSRITAVSAGDVWLIQG